MEDADQPLYENSESTKGSFAADLSAVFDASNIPISVRDNMLSVLNQHCGALLNLPVKETKDHITKDTSSKYSTPDYRALQVDICQMGCMVFMGEDVDRTRCSVCKSPRYTPCSHRHCKDKSYDECNHSKKNRIPIKVVHYRPIIPLLRDLLRFPKFRQALQYGTEKMNNRSDILTDVLDGTACRVAWDHMDDRFMKLEHEKQIEYTNVPVFRTQSLSNTPY